jgi:hypothetical protein
LQDEKEKSSLQGECIKQNEKNDQILFVLKKEKSDFSHQSMLWEIPALRSKISITVIQIIKVGKYDYGG